jgi:rod shape-determining protein MreD
MNWLVFSIFSAAALLFETGLRPLWHIGPASPSLLLILAVFVALAAPPVAVYWAMLVIGLLMDASGAAPPALIGPSALGCLAGGYLALQLRPIFYRESPLPLAVCVGIVGVFVLLVVAALLTVRAISFLGGTPDWDPADYLLNHFLSVLYSAAVALPLGWLLRRSRPLWRFHGQSGPRPY